MMLAVFLPMLLLSSIHTHETAEGAETSSIDCLHEHCGGHLTQTTVQMDDCVLCQFMTLTMLTAAAIAITLNIHVYKRAYALPSRDCHTACQGVIVTRGPPVF